MKTNICKMLYATWFALACNISAWTQCTTPLNDQAMGLLDNAPALPYSFIVIGDSEMSQVFIDMMTHIQNTYSNGEIAFIINNGDFLSGGDANQSTYEDYHAFASNFMGQSGIPYFSVPGNHDVECGQCEVFYADCVGEQNWQFDFAGSCFIGIHNVQQDPGWVAPGYQAESEAYSIPDETIESVNDYLNQTSCEHLFNFSHAALSWANYGCSYPGYMEYYSMLVGNGLTANFAGHIHHYSTEQNDLTGTYDIVSGAAGPHISSLFSTSVPKRYSDGPSYTVITVDENNEISLELQIFDADANAPPYYIEAPQFGFDFVDCDYPDCPTTDHRSLYNDEVKPIINRIEQDGKCYTCIENLTGIYDDLTIKIDDVIATNPVDLGNDQRCFELPCPSCDVVIEVAYESCASAGQTPPTESIFFDPQDIETMINQIVVEIDPCGQFIILHLNDNISVESTAWRIWGPKETSHETLFNNKLKISWDEYLVTRISLDVKLDFAGCSYEETIAIDIPLCTNDGCCPPGSGYNGAGCYFMIQIPPGYDPFIWNDNFYTHHGPGGPEDCPQGSDWDGAHCSYGIGVPDGYDAFIWQNGFYAHENCAIDLEKCCPPESTWNGAGCDYGIRIPTGFTGFIGPNNGLYSTTNIAGDCPPGTTLDAIGCYFGIDITAGLNGFVWQNGFYAHEKCDIDKCCPDGTKWNGSYCEKKSDWPETDGFIHTDGQLYIKPDLNEPCPTGTQPNPVLNACATGQFVTPGYDVTFEEGVLKYLPDCEICCPDGFKFDGEGCCKKVYLKNLEILYIQGIATVAFDCTRYPTTCCPEGFGISRNGCTLNRDTETENYILIDQVLTICSQREHCLDDAAFSNESENSQNRNISSQQEGLIKSLVFPNPFSSQLSIELKNSDSHLQSIDILSTAGKIVFSKTIPSDHQQIFSIHPEIETGIYVLLLKFQDRQEQIKIIRINL